jgi:hypothetical protein
MHSLRQEAKSGKYRLKKAENLRIDIIVFFLKIYYLSSKQQYSSNLFWV